MKKCECELKNTLNGLRTAVEEFREVQKLFMENKQVEYMLGIRFAELSIIQMAESLIDKMDDR